MATIERNSYDAETQTLKLVFGYENDLEYSFFEVPAEIGEGFETAESKGKFFHANVRGKFDYVKDFIQQAIGRFAVSYKPQKP